MSVTSIMIAGVGGQGLVLLTRVLAQVALAAGYDVKSGDVVGLAQRGGMVWGSVRYGEKVHSPLIPRGQGDFMIAMEALEGLRFAHMLKPSAKVFLSKYRILPNRVLIEKDEYPANIPLLLGERGLVVVEIDAEQMAVDLGNRRLSNTLLLGALSVELPFSKDHWEDALRENVPPKTLDLNLLAFAAGRNTEAQTCATT
ncbi:MAG: hypothetical protein DDT36_01421 [Firmicutes bacterium]|nr:hypothetical protein [Bacillota bacterium]